VDKSDKEIWSNLNERADQFEMPVEDFVWDAIESDLFPQSKRRGLFFWLKTSIGLLFIGLLAAASIVLFTPSKDVLSQQKMVRENENKLHVSQHKFTEKTTTFEKDQSELGDNHVQSTSLEAESTQNKQTAPHFTTNKSQPFTQRSSPILYTTLNKNQETATQNERAALNKQDEQENARRSEELEGEAAASNQEMLDTDRVDVEKDPPHADAEAAIEFVDTTNRNVGIDSIHETDYQAENAPNNFSRFSILLRGGIGESFRILTSSSHQELIAHKNDHETFGGCFNAGLDVQFKLNDRFILRTGLGYKFYSDKYDFQHDLISHRTRNDYQYIQIPLIFGYSLWSNKRSSLFLLGGGNANLLSSAQSSWIDPSLLIPVIHSSQGSGTPFRSITSAINLGVDFNTKIGDRFNLHIIPSVDSFINSIYKRETDLTELPYSFNFDIGLSYQF